MGYTGRPRPQFVIPVDAGERWLIQNNPDGNDILRDPDVMLVQLPVENESDSLVQHLNDNEQLRRGEVLMRNPFHASEYFPIADAPDQVPLAKFFLFSQFCALLGARRIHIEQIERLDVDGRKEAVFNLSALNTAVGGSDSFVNRFRRSISQTMEFEGCEPDIKAAEALIIGARLQQEVTFSAILRQRSSKNRLTKIEQVLNLTSEVSRALERFGRIRLPEQLGDFGLSFYSRQKQVKDYTLVISVEF